ncbi:pentatricopeptide repeat domain-containing protein [Colletotrichum karsti]|uniref:Pentatricopeptide repeat domain-containing protein n=1 Tax=Colletotrichum karsti TaxID=1095194 RepID=A0A9P6HVQ6_9PEZI|nr:pentatricopeptide repeat domain-containing protein [Colletotrichum karsti]KAF9870832.1 pentatricopeptide repeat domain-containing protein [Colletotrichum karsti]
MRPKPATRDQKAPKNRGTLRIDREANDLLLREADLGLVDISENENDILFWLDLVNAAKREHGQAGVLAVWEAMDVRKTLSDTEGQEAEMLWKAMLNAALDDEGRLDRVFLYAEWMFKVRSVQWPDLYSTIVSHCLRNGQFMRAMQWHIRLMPTFDPGSEAFSDMLRHFVTSTDTQMQQALQSLYVSTFHHGLYDEIIPLLFESGLSELCAEWRKLFLRFHDLPRLTAESQPYLSFLVRYFPGTSLELEEQLVLDVNSSAYWDVKHDSLWDAMNGTHGEDDSPTGRRYSDKLGARWFASSWVPLDFAIHAVHALGVHQIGPLSLQSIALREPTPDGVIARITQLHKVNIGIGHSTYALAVRNFAKAGDSELLHELLHTDIHPDVFDDPEMLQSIRDKAFESGARQTYRLLLAIQPAMAQESIESISNMLLQQRLKQRQNQQALALLDDMRSMNIDLSAASLQHIYSDVLETLPWKLEVDPANWKSLQEAIAFLNRLMLIQKPVPARYWRKTLFGLGRFGRLDELEDLCLAILDTHEARSASPGGLLPVHPTDAPPSNVGALTENLVVPADLPIAHTYHPMRQIFDKSALHVAIARWGFKAGSPRDLSERSPHAGPAVELAITRGVQLLAKLEERGIPVNASTLRGEVIRCLARLYRPGNNRTKALPALAVVIQQINKTAGRISEKQLLPSVHTVQGFITSSEGQRRREKHSQVTQSR